jgi:hypothetical protein
MRWREPLRVTQSRSLPSGRPWHFYIRQAQLSKRPWRAEGKFPVIRSHKGLKILGHLRTVRPPIQVLTSLFDRNHRGSALETAPFEQGSQAADKSGILMRPARRGAQREHDYAYRDCEVVQ